LAKSIDSSPGLKQIPLAPEIIIISGI